MELQFPLKLIDQHTDKTPEHWFDEYSVALQQSGHNTIPLVNKDPVAKYALVRYRGLVSNQLNSEYFDKIAQFRESVDMDTANVDPSRKADIKQRYPMVIRTEPNHSPWAKKLVFGSTQMDPTDIRKVMAKFYCHHNSIRIADTVEIYGIWCPKQEDEDDGDQKMSDTVAVGGNDGKLKDNNVEFLCSTVSKSNHNDKMINQRFNKSLLETLWIFMTIYFDHKLHGLCPLGLSPLGFSPLRLSPLSPSHALFQVLQITSKIRKIQKQNRISIPNEVHTQRFQPFTCYIGGRSKTATH